ncbi:MAG: transglycosylase SLT domain-containing protein, partial [Limnohabitans sp.]|nr:transglycosylase SLT domain-containing protein [Limnohabitans sp.]
ADRPDYIQRMTARSSKYLYHIVEELEQRNMPTELALLPFIESAFNPQAVSSARASGMWQFMPRTGKHFDLKQNAFRDDRRDVLASTRAALDYLQRLHGMFGDWHLALAAYNWGEGNVGKALARNKRLGEPLNYTELRMPAETRMYVPKLQAMENLVANPDALGVTLPTIPNHPYFQTVPLPRDADVAVIAKLAEVSMDDFKALNPSAHRPVMLASGTPHILLPWDNAEIFQRNLESHDGQLASWTAWVAPKNMKVADAAKRVGMSEEELRTVNKIPPRMLIKAGSALLVPRSISHQKDVSEKLADNGQLNLAPEQVLRKQVVKARKGDTMASVAKRYKVSVDQLADWNKLALNSSLKPGQKVMLMLPGKAKKSKAVAGKKRRQTANKPG